MNVPFSHPSGGRPQKDGRKVRWCWKGTFTFRLPGGRPDAVPTRSPPPRESGAPRAFISPRRPVRTAKLRVQSPGPCPTPITAPGSVTRRLLWSRGGP